MNTNEVQTEPLSVGPGSYSADALAASVSEKFAALFQQVHPPVLTTKSDPAWVEKEAQVEEMN